METLLDLRPNPIKVPEILRHILLHLDRPFLDICARASRFWRALALDVAAHSFIQSKDILEFLARRNGGEPDGPQGQSTTTTLSALINTLAAQEFHGRCAGLQSLTIGDAWSGKEEYGEAFDIGKVVQWESAVPASLTNLVRFHVRFVCASQPYDRVDSLPNKVFRTSLLRTL